ncbi:MAG: hypothetical protein ACQEP3_00205 [Patescibacteria group bacterium]
MNGDILAKIIGLSFFTISFVFLYNKKALKALVRLFMSREFLVMTGSLFTVIGIIIISIHNVWELSWRGVVTLTGWMFLVEGLFRLFFMDLTIKIMKELKSFTPIKLSLMFTLSVGAYLILVSFL